MLKMATLFSFQLKKSFTEINPICPIEIIGKHQFAKNNFFPITAYLIISDEKLNFWEGGYILCLVHGKVLLTQFFAP